MKRIISTAIFVLFCVFASSASGPQRGYRGFLDTRAEYTFYTGGHTHFAGLATSHGYQFNPDFFFGIGLGAQIGFHSGNGAAMSYPIFLQGRYDRMFGNLPLFADLRMGCTVLGNKLYDGDDKLFIAPSFGYRLDTDRKTCLNIGLGVNFHGCDKGNNRFTWRVGPQISVGIEF